MEKYAKTRFDRVWDLAQTDKTYAEMLEQMTRLEAQYDRVLENLDDAQRDIVCDYVNLCEDMSRRMLEVACENL